MNTRKLVGISLFAAAAYIVSYFSFPILPYLSFLKLDFSDLAVLLSTFAYGPMAGTMVAFIRSFLHYLLTGGEAGIPIGDSAAFIASVTFVLPMYAYMKGKMWTVKNKVIASFAGTLSFTLVLTLLNWFVLVPAYSYVLNFDVGPMVEYLLYGVVPFNLIKGALLSIMFFLLMPRLMPYLKRKN